jgi:hypothetical protein
LQKAKIRKEYLLIIDRKGQPFIENDRRMEQGGEVEGPGGLFERIAGRLRREAI